MNIISARYEYWYNKEDDILMCREMETDRPGRFVTKSLVREKLKVIPSLLEDLARLPGLNINEVKRLVAKAPN